MMESKVDHMLGIIRPDMSCLLFLNDLPFTVVSRAKKRIAAGESVTLDNILDVMRIRLKGVTVPNNAGLVALFSAGWRKGLFFDFLPLLDNKPERAYDVEATLGQYYAYLHFQQMLAMPDLVWDEFVKQGWFPFISLRQATIRPMIGAAAEGNAIDDHLDLIAADTGAALLDQRGEWKTFPALAEHYDVIEIAQKRYDEGDFVSVISILFPRIEGIMRTHFGMSGAGKATQEALLKCVTERAELPQHSQSLLLPHRFQRFLREVYFAHFDPSNPQGLSRNTVSHGVAPGNLLNKKGAVLAFLILLQIVALLPRAPSPKPS